jgi:hypothetical protein
MTITSPLMSTRGLRPCWRILSRMRRTARQRRRHQWCRKTALVRRLGVQPRGTTYEGFATSSATMTRVTSAPRRRYEPPSLSAESHDVERCGMAAEACTPRIQRSWQ